MLFAINSTAANIFSASKPGDTIKHSRNFTMILASWRSWSIASHAWSLRKQGVEAYGSKQGDEGGSWTCFPECSARVKRTLPRWSGLDPAPRGNIESQDVLLCHPGLADLLVMNMLPTAIHAQVRSTENMYGLSRVRLYPFRNMSRKV